MNNNVYFISSGDIRIDGTPIKIGFTRSDPKYRLAAIQMAHHEELRVVHLLQIRTAQKAQRLEKKLHILFANHRIRGDWFRACPAIREFVAAFESDRQKAWRMVERETKSPVAA